jgi:enoyl-CoA hydratase/carnithine racemase
MTEAVLFEDRGDGIALITINRPERRNALSAEVRTGLYEAWTRFEDTLSLRVAILTGAGDRAFCAGGDLREMAEAALAVAPRKLAPIPGETVEVTKPTIAAVNGAAIAGGWLLAQSCDLCVASDHASFGISEVRVGRSAPWAAALIHMIPQRVMMELLLTGLPITASRAYEIGFVNRLTPPDRLVDEALKLASQILAGAPLSVAAARQTVMLATEMGRSAALRAARLAFDRADRSEDAQEGPRSFVEKRAPVWKGV